MAVRKSILGILSGLTLAFVGLVSQPAAAEAAGECSMVLTEAQQARSTLESITAAMEQGMADRAAWVERLAEIDSELKELIVEKKTDLQRERAQLVEELRTLDKLHPVLSNQAEALRAIVDETERAYISCIEATL
jgi:chromosome segregation ATPase